MDQDLNLFSFQRAIQAPADQVYRSFTSGPGLQEWLCNSAMVSPRPGGFLTLAWNSGFYTLGEFIRLEPNNEILFTWHGRSEPQPTQVQVLLSEHKNLTQVELIHSCIGNEEIWIEAKRSIQRGWENSLNNLESVLTTGVDQRIVNKPAIGIYPIEMNPELAALSGAPVTSGIYLDIVIEGRSAHRAGLAKGDVIIEIDGESINDLPSLVRALQSFRIGDEFSVVYYRGKKRAETRLELLPMPVPNVPLEPAALAAHVNDSYTSGYQELHACFEGISEDVASQKTGGHWSAKEVLAHLIHTEKDLQYSIQCAIVDQDFRWTDNTSARVEATLRAFPTQVELLEELRRAQLETIAFLERLPEVFTRRKSSFWNLGYGILSLHSHTQEHISQIQQAVHLAQG